MEITVTIRNFRGDTGTRTNEERHPATVTAQLGATFCCGRLRITCENIMFAWYFLVCKWSGDGIPQHVVPFPKSDVYVLAVYQR